MQSPADGPTGLNRKEQVLRQARVIKRVLSASALTMAVTLACGCDVPSFLDPTELTPGDNYQKRTLQKPVLSSLSSIDPSIDDPDQEFYNATEVQPMDLEVIATDYKIGVGDLINISVNDLVGLGVETTKQTRVSESGNVSMPLLGQIKAVGLTEDELQKAIAQAYKDGQIITNAQVSVTVAEARARTFSALGAVGVPGQYAILQSDFRLLDAMVLVHDVALTTDTIYVIRQIKEDPTPGSVPVTPGTPSRPGTPSNQLQPAIPSRTVDPLAPKGDVLSTPRHMAMLQAPADTLAPSAGAKSDSGAFQFAAPTGQPETRTIRIPYDALRNGEIAKYNIVIRPHDLIVAPNPVTGEYYMGGHVARVGVYSIAPRKITLKQAIVSAGMLDGAAIPQRTELIRRIGPAREAFVLIDTNAIFAGLQPDIFLKPNDIINVGTNILAPFIGAIRGGFRLTYGFGFLYDRNFSPAQSG
jgi:polysaccharide export outer membrane protein